MGAPTPATGHSEMPINPNEVALPAHLVIPPACNTCNLTVAIHTKRTFQFIQAMSAGNFLYVNAILNPK